jgi:hypothetical protein
LTTAIPLDRRFEEWSETEASDPALRARWGFKHHDRTWDSLLTKQRVVVLAEAGSGKSEELKEQAARKVAAGEFAFIATVQDVGRKGLNDALHPRDRGKLDEWQKSNSPGWFFIDSVDEAKFDGVRLDQACRELAGAIHGAEGRAHIILSGRLTDWEFQRDLKRFNDELPVVTPATETPPKLSPDELVIRAIRHNVPEEKEIVGEMPLVVAMLPLDEDRVRTFAAGKGIHAADLNEFIFQIDTANLWRFARRPLDLDWMVQFWRANRRLGSLREMLENSLTERLREPNPDRARRDSLDTERAFHGLERIGAALVLGRTETIAIPDATLVLAGATAPLDIADVLSDWSAEDRARLLTRPVFDPATFGRARLHNDNEKVVSAFLAARWLRRLRAANLSQSDLFDLLFAKSCGISLIKPSMQETAAWLASWDPAVAREVVKLNPFLLLTAGDPASLPFDIRCVALTQCLKRIIQGARSPLMDNDSLMRFARADLVETIHGLWAKHSGSIEAKNFLLRLIWRGSLTGCADLATEAVFLEQSDDSSFSLFALRALCASADATTKRKYVGHLLSRLDKDRNAVVWSAVEELFPSSLTIEDLFTILGSVDVTDCDGLGFEYLGPKLIERLVSVSDLERLLSGLLTLLGAMSPEIGYQPTKREEAYFPIISEAASRLLALSPVTVAPTVAIDAVIRLGEYRHDPHAKEAVVDPKVELDCSPARRRQAFWRAAERLDAHPTLQGRSLEHTWELGMLGFQTKLVLEDVDWLLADGPKRQAQHQQRLAIHAVLEIWRDAASPPAILRKIEDATRDSVTASNAMREWLSPRPQSSESAKHEREMRKITERGRRERARVDQSWIDATAKWRSDPAELRHLSPVSEKGVDGRLYNLWQLLERSVPQKARYAIEEVSPLEPIIGSEAALAVRDGLVGLWRQWKPRLKSERDLAGRNTINSVDCMGIAGITLEAKGSPRWSEALSPDEARRATEYATLELSGFPFWISDLAVSHPDQVRVVLMREVISEIDRFEPGTHAATLSTIDRTDARISGVIASDLFRELADRPNLSAGILAPVLRIIGRGLNVSESAALTQVCLCRFRDTADPAVASLYLRSVFEEAADRATDAFVEKLNRLSEQDQSILAAHAMPTIFGGRFGRDDIPLIDIPSHVLERLVIIAFRTIRVEEDDNRPSGEVFSPNTRDDAEGARSNVFGLLVRSPGQATFDAITRFRQMNDFSIPKAHLSDLAFERAAQDAETAPWNPTDFLAFEKTFETAPSNGKDLKSVLLRRLNDVQHDLLHSDFAQGQSFKGLPAEVDVQNWVADRLRLKQGRSFSVEREPHVIDEKEPDIRARAKAGDASVAIEIKVAESWTLEQLEAALTNQLCARYLRADDGRHGILLLVHQVERASGWKSQNGYFTFAQVVVRLQEIALRICGASWDGPQPEIAVLDVSSCSPYGTRSVKGTEPPATHRSQKPTSPKGGLASAGSKLERREPRVSRPGTRGMRPK